MLVLRGENEQGFIARMIDRWPARDPRVQATTIPDAGHLVNQDAPDACNTALVRFLQEHLPVPTDTPVPT